MMAKQALVFPQPVEVADEPLLDTAEAARLLGLAPLTLKKLAQQRKIPSIKYGRLRRFERCALRAYIAQHRVG
jgi:excisionase family DNA binding protein